jgi:protocatechuate 3,4-dioxygenase beta subunit
MKTARFASVLLATSLVALVIAPAISASAIPTVGSAAHLSPKDSSRTVIVAEGEPGESMIVSGVVYRDGRPAAGIRVEVYQTDNDGYYERKDKPSDGHRIKGAMITDSAGRYEFRTIKPAPYPGRSIPAHIHYIITGPGISRQTDEVQFEGDRYIQEKLTPAEQADRFNEVRPVTRVEGVLRVTKDIRVD